MQYFLPYEKFNELLKILNDKNYECIGPQVKNHAIVFDTLDDIKQLPWGIQETQSPGDYQLHQTGKKQAFAWANGPQAIKPLIFKAEEPMWRVKRDKSGKLNFERFKPAIKQQAIIGAKACDLAALAVQDRVFLKDKYQDAHYKARREALFIVGVNCSYASSNCFCVSTDTGPKITQYYDLVLTEIEDGFTIKQDSVKGDEVLQNLHLNPCDKLQLQAAEKVTQQAINRQTKKMPKNNTSALLPLLMNNLDHPRWDEVADRCLSCGNCTMVCPTCFCHHEIETMHVDATNSTHSREWDSCFTTGHSYVHGKVIRDDIKSRYKQWLTHKLATWWEQFDTSGCVGCGRCISWCPVGIDLTEEVAAISGESNVISNEDENDKP